MKTLTEHQTRVLLDRLIAMSESGDLSWSPDRDDVDAHRFEATVGNSTFTIESTDFDDQHPYRFEIYRDGVLVQEVATETHGGGVPKSKLNDALDGLYGRAKRQAMNLDSLVSDLFADVGVEVPPEEDPLPEVPF